MTRDYAVVRRLLGERGTERLRGHLQAHRLFRGAYDTAEREMALIPRLVGPGDVALDVGANIGVYTRLLSRAVGSRGHVHAFEPIGRTYERLVRHVRRLPLSNVTSYHVAVDREVGRVPMVVPDMGARSMYRAHLLPDHDPETGARQRVRTLPLDTLYGRAFDRVALIKCDVEGAELRVLEGARHCIEQERPRLLLEVNDAASRFGSSGSRVFAWLRERGYAAWVHDGEQLRPCPEPSARWGTPNYLFAPSGRSPLD